MELHGNKNDSKPHPGYRTLGVSFENDETLANSCLLSRPVEHLLVATNFTERSEYAIERAVECGNRLKAQVTLLHVIEPGLSRKITKCRQHEAHEALKRRVQILSPDVRSHISTNVRIGEPCFEIVRESIELGSDTIILGLDGQGQTATAVVRFSNKPVLLITRRPAGPYHCSVVDVSAIPRCTASAAVRLAPTAISHFVYVRSQFAVGSSKKGPPPARSVQLIISPGHDRRVLGTRWMPDSLVQATGDPIDVLLNVVDRVSANLLVVDAYSALQETREHRICLAQDFAAAPRCDLLVVASQ
ncbi:universal stress protein [Bradyrhizobium sp. CCBAU 051011]|uniref:universal stress protein n=1 Tax=Bradyrhizobium sp. CCBAU 051011 TaxID=858422 RepID=UPI00137A178C|nr:universal stress protein [Bradyrhizobium sp. CCBAU 051011]